MGEPHPPTCRSVTSPEPARQQESSAFAAGEAPTHSTAAGILVSGGRVLLERRPADAAIYADCWDIPGGHVEAGETPEQAVVREMREELGIEVLRLALCVVQDDREQPSGRFYRHFNFVVREYRGEITAREAQALEWWDVTAAIASDALNPLACHVIERCTSEGWV